MVVPLSDVAGEQLIVKVEALGPPNYETDAGTRRDTAEGRVCGLHLTCPSWIPAHPPTPLPSVLQLAQHPGALPTLPA